MMERWEIGIYIAWGIGADMREIRSSYKMLAYVTIFVHNDRLRTVLEDIKPSELIYGRVHIARAYNFIQRSFFTDTIIYVYQVCTYIKFNGPVVNSHRN